MTSIAFETSALGAALREVRGAVQRRNTIPILSNVLVEAEADGTVRLTTTDLDVMVTRTLTATTADAAAFTLDANRLADVVGSFAPGSQTTIKIADGAAIVTSGRARLRFAILPRADFPLLTQRSASASFAIEAKALTHALGVVRHAVSSEATRYYLNGVFVHASGGKLRFAATDGHRLACYADDLPAGAEGMPDMILRTSCIDLIRAAADTRDAPISVTVGDGKVVMATGDYRMVAKVVDGTFPDYTRVIPSGNHRTAVVDRDALIETLGRVSLAVSDKVRVVRVVLERDMLRASIQSPEHGAAVDEVPCDYAGDPFEIGFNSRYFRDALTVFDVDHVDIALGDAATAALITSPKASGVKLVLMPMRV